jgi:hypothetical protein
MNKISTGTYTRSTVYGWIKKISPVRTIETEGRGHDGQLNGTINSSIVVNITFVEKGKTNQIYYQIAFWGVNAERFIDNNIKERDYVCIDLYDLNIGAFLDKKTEPPTPRAFITAKGLFIHAFYNDTKENQSGPESANLQDLSQGSL